MQKEVVNSRNRPMIVTLLGDLCFLGGLFLLLSLLSFFPEHGFRVIIPDYWHIPVIPEWLITIILASFYMITAYGYLKLKIWGYWLHVLSNAYSILGSIILYLLDNPPVIFPITSMIALLYIIPTYKYYSKKDKVIPVNE